MWIQQAIVQGLASAVGIVLGGAALVWLDRFLSRRDAMEAILTQMGNLDTLIAVTIKQQERAQGQGGSLTFFEHWPLEAENLKNLLENLPAKDVSPKWRASLFLLRFQTENCLRQAEFAGGYDRSAKRRLELGSEELPSLMAQKIDDISEDLQRLRTQIWGYSKSYAKAYWLHDPIKSKRSKDEE